MTDHKALITEAQDSLQAWATWQWEHKLVSRLADALEAATRELAFERLRKVDEQIEDAERRAVVEAQALEQAAEDMDSSALWVENNFMPGPNGDAHCMVMRTGADWLRARAVEIREGRQ